MEYKTADYHVHSTISPDAKGTMEEMCNAAMAAGIEEIAFTERQIREEWDRHRESDRNYLFDHMDENLMRHMEEVRLGRKNLK